MKNEQENNHNNPWYNHNVSKVEKSTLKSKQNLCTLRFIGLIYDFNCKPDIKLFDGISAYFECYIESEKQIIKSS